MEAEIGYSSITLTLTNLKWLITVLLYCLSVNKHKGLAISKIKTKKDAKVGPIK